MTPNVNSVVKKGHFFVDILGYSSLYGIVLF